MAKRPVAIGENMVFKDWSGCRLIARDHMIDPNLIVIGTSAPIEKKYRTGPGVIVTDSTGKWTTTECALETTPEQLRDIALTLTGLAEKKLQRGFRPRSFAGRSTLR